MDTISILTPAIRLYEKLGFKHVPIHRTLGVGTGEYKRSDVKMEIPVSETIPVHWRPNVIIAKSIDCLLVL